MSENPQITELLVRWSAGEHDVLEELMENVYDELRILARSHLRQEANDSLATRTLIHEAYLKLLDQRRVSWANRTHFFGIATRIMRRIIVDRARDRKAQKRGGGVQPLALEEAFHLEEGVPDEVLAINDALDALQDVDPEMVRLVEMRFFGGFTHGEIAEIEGVSVATIDRRWRLARAWLHESLAP